MTFSSKQTKLYNMHVIQVITFLVAIMMLHSKTLHHGLSSLCWLKKMQNRTFPWRRIFKILMFLKESIQCLTRQSMPIRTEEIIFFSSCCDKTKDSTSDNHFRWQMMKIKPFLEEKNLIGVIITSWKLLKWSCLWKRSRLTVESANYTKQSHIFFSVLTMILQILIKFSP